MKPPSWFLFVAGLLASCAHDAPVTGICTSSTDCGWTEIDHEILTATDCPCLFGCPSIVTDVMTVMRRKAQYDAFCTPGRDGMGRGCPVDDCAGPPTPVCRAGVCQGQ
jgi:hypothetical protein